MEGATSETAPAVKVNGLTFTFAPGTPDTLKDVSFELPRGSRCVIVGQNGAGKSTLLEVLSGMKMVPAGMVSVCGADPFRTNAGNKVSHIQGGWRSVGDAIGQGQVEVMFVWEMVGMPRPGSTDAAPSAGGPPESELRVKRLHEHLGLGRLLTRRCGQLSDGERRRVELARKLKERCEVVLLDEATTDLDMVSRANLMKFLTDDGATVINVTHVFDGMESWATHVIHMHDGKLVRSEEVKESYWHSMMKQGLFAQVHDWLTACVGSAAYGATPLAMPMASAEMHKGPALEVNKLSFAYESWCPTALSLEQLSLPMGCRCLLVGANGAGKSTLLSIVAGRRMLVEGAGEVAVLGRKAFHDHALLDPLVSVLSSEWKRQVAEISSGRSLTFQHLANDALQELMAKGFDMALLAGRMVRLIQMLGIDPAKPLGMMSDGMMRRVQIALKLLRPSKLLLVDEVTADLDVLARKALLAFLKEESEAGSAVVYCTHIMDGLDGWPSHLLRMKPCGHGGELMGLPSSVEELAKVLDGKLADAVMRMLLEDVKLEASAPLEIPEPPPSDLSKETELPPGWLNRQAAKEGAYGSYAWQPQRGPEETWSFGSTAPPPTNAPPIRPSQPTPDPNTFMGGFMANQAAGAAPFGGPAGAGMPGMPGAMPGMPGAGMPGMPGAMPGMPGAGMPGMPGAMPGMPGAMPGMLGAGMPGAPGAFGAPGGGYAGQGALGAPGAPSAAAAQAQPAERSAPVRPAADDPCPPGFASRSNQLPLEELIARRIVIPEKPHAGR